MLVGSPPLIVIHTSYPLPGTVPPTFGLKEQMLVVFNSSRLSTPSVIENPAVIAETFFKLLFINHKK